MRISKREQDAETVGEVRKAIASEHLRWVREAQEEKKKELGVLLALVVIAVILMTVVTVQRKSPCKTSGVLRDRGWVTLRGGRRTDKAPACSPRQAEAPR